MTADRLKRKTKTFWIMVKDSDGFNKAVSVTASVVRIDDDTFIYFDKKHRQWVLTDERSGLNFGNKYISKNLNALYESYVSEDNSDDKSKVEQYRTTDHYKKYADEFRLMIEQAKKESEAKQDERL